jgi:hypothetical protein
MSRAVAFSFGLFGFGRRGSLLPVIHLGLVRIEIQDADLSVKYVAAAERIAPLERQISGLQSRLRRWHDEARSLMSRPDALVVDVVDLRHQLDLLTQRVETLEMGRCDE